MEGINPDRQFLILWVLLFSLFYCKDSGYQILRLEKTIICGYRKGPLNLAGLFYFLKYFEDSDD